MTYVYELREYSTLNVGSYSLHGFFSTLPVLKEHALKLLHAKTEERCTPKGWAFNDYCACRSGDTQDFLGTFFSFTRHEVIHK